MHWSTGRRPSGTAQEPAQEVQKAAPRAYPGVLAVVIAHYRYWPTSLVGAVPPRSGVLILVVASTSAIAFSTALLAADSPRWSSIIAPAQTAPTGLARPVPAMSGADPCTGSNMPGLVRSGVMLALAAMPMPPWITAPMSVRMSPKRFDATMTSNRSGALIM